MYYEQICQSDYRYFNLLMVKMVYDFNPGNTKKVFKKLSLDIHPEDVFVYCLKAIAPETRVYYHKKNLAFTDATIVFKSPCIQQVFDLKRRLENRMEKNSDLKPFHNDICSSLRCACDWLNYLEYSAGIRTQFLRGDMGIFNRVRIDDIILGETEILYGLICFLTWIEAAVEKVLNNENVRRWVYAKL